MRYLIPLFLYLFLSFSAHNGIGQKRNKLQKEKEAFLSGKTDKPNDERKQIEAEAIFIEAMKYFILDDHKTALAKFIESDALYNQSAATKYQIAFCYAKLDAFDKALPYATEAVALDGQNKYYYALLADVYKSQNQLEKAVETYLALLENTTGSTDYYFELASAYLFMGKYKEAIGAYDELEDRMGINESIIRQKQRIYLNLNDLDAAIAEGEKLVKAYPDIHEFSMAQAELLISNNKSDDALKIIEALKETNGDDPRLGLLMADVYRAQGNKTAYLEAMERTLASPELDFADKEGLINRILQESYQKRYVSEESLRLVKLAAEAHPGTNQANSYYAQLLLMAEKYQDARDYLIKAIRADADNFEAWHQIIQLDWQLNQVDSVVAHAEAALEYFPNQAVLYLHNGTGNYMLKNYEEAMLMLEQGRLFAVNEEMIAQFNAQLGDTYHYMEEYQKSEMAYSEVLKNDPDNVHVLNNFSYFLSIRKEKLDTALKMAERLVGLEPNQPNYLDTYGWVLYNMGNYKAAKVQLEKAVQLSQDATIMEHYGDVLFKLGKVDEALGYWKKAKEAGQDYSEDLDEKIATRKLID